MDDVAYEMLKAALRRLTGLDLSQYKEQQMRRRLASYVAGKNMASDEFCRLITYEPEELRKVREFITINVTEFFRDPSQFGVLKSQVLPEILKQPGRLNIWSAGCSIGAEPYTVAIILSGLTPGVRHRILASDLDEQALAHAKAGGPYKDMDLRALPKMDRIRHFTETDGGWMVNDDIRAAVQFQQYNMLGKPPERGFDLILCRNVVIYFSDETKRMLDQRFNDALKPNGWLFIGGSETMLSAKELGFERRYSSFYQKSGEEASPARRRLAA